MEAQIEAFGAWLRKQGYAESTVLNSMRDARRISQWDDSQGLPPQALRPSITRMRNFGAWPVDVEARLESTLNQPKPSLQQRRVALRTQRKRKERSIPDEDWSKFVQALAEGAARGDPRDAVLLVMACTALRLGDVLKITRQQLRDGIKRGYLQIEVKGGMDRVLPIEGAQDAWAILVGVVGAHPNVATAVCPRGNGSPLSYQGAGKAVQRRLADFSGLVSGRLHSHRLRRTVAVQTLRLAGLDAARQMLGNVSFQAAQTYLDELRPDALAELYKKLAKHRTTTEE